MRALARLPHSVIRQRANLVRNFVECLSTDLASNAEVWASSCVPLSELMAAARVSIVLHAGGGDKGEGDRIVCTFSDGVASVPLSPGVSEDTLAAAVFRSNETVIWGDEGSETKSIGVPIRFATTLLGAICIERAESHDKELITLLESCALSAGSRIHNDAMVDNTARYEKLAFTDALTGIANRRRFDETLAIEWARGARSGAPLAMLMMDVDFFKVYNDTYGHPAGDDCLQKVARALREGVQRPADLIARYGGEEFVALLPGVDPTGAAHLAELLIANVAKLVIPHSGSSLERVSLSIGVASVVPTFDAESSTLSLAADAALYEAKHAGRNRVWAKGYEASEEPLSATMRRKAPLNNLPRQHTRLIGRVTEVSEIKALIAEESLTTLTACGGAGKTRISLAIATDLAPEFPDGTWFVDLARVSDPTLIPTNVGLLFSLDIQPGENAVLALSRALATKRSLVIFDNCEHVIDAVADIAAAMLATCSDIRILATSREPLGIGGEAIYRLPLLSVPPNGTKLGAKEAGAYDSVALFAERAKAVKRSFVITDENASAIADICLQLDGIPLAIELAAARVSVISLSEISSRLAERFRLLKGGDRSALPRQQTMRALIDWSYDLLSLEEQLVFRRLAVFAGGWTIEAMSEICAGTDLDEDDVFDLLGGLIRKSLVVDSTNGDESRYRLLESVRQYAREKLDSSDESDVLHRRHATYYLRCADAAKATHFTTPSKQWLCSLQPEAENFRSALTWCLSLEKDIRLGATLAGALVVFLAQGSPSESLRWTRKALALLPPDTEPAIEAALWYGVGRAAENLPAEQMREAAERAVKLSRISGNQTLLGEALRQYILVLGWYYPDEAELTGMLSLEAMQRARSVGDPIQIALALRSRSVTIDNADVANKLSVLEESLTLLLAHGNDLQTAVAFMWLAEYDFCFCGGEKASTYAREAIRFSDESGSASMSAQMAANLAQYSAGEGDWKAARRAAHEAAQAALHLGMDDQVTWAVQALAIVSAGHGDYITAARLLGFCDSRVGTLHSQRQTDCAEDILYRKLLETLREHLSVAVLDAAMLAGSGLTESDALQTALAISGPAIESREVAAVA